VLQASVSTCKKSIAFTLAILKKSIGSTTNNNTTLYCINKLDSLFTVNHEIASAIDWSILLTDWLKHHKLVAAQQLM